MEKPVDLPELIQFRGPFLEAADTEHLPQQLKALFAC